MLLAFILFAVGLFILIKGADFLIEGASSIGLHLKVKPIVIGLTVVAFGTSAPEFLISVLSAMRGSTDLALGNIIGSNISNTLLIIGAAAVIYPIKLHKNSVWKEIPLSFLAALVTLVFGIQTIIDNGWFSTIDLNSADIIGELTFTNGLTLLFFFVIFLYYSFGIAKASGEGDKDIHKIPIPKSIIFVLVGFVGLAFGSQLSVDNAIVIAKGFNISEGIIGLTMVALGTSLPELVTSITASLKKETDLAVGNVLGSNIFNVFLILGATAMVRPIPITGYNVAEMLILMIVTSVLFGSLFILKKHQVTRLEGSVFLLMYLFFNIYIFFRSVA
jgi:cation:H+ antiporter